MGAIREGRPDRALCLAFGQGDGGGTGSRTRDFRISRSPFAVLGDLYGAPALSLEQFAQYKQDLIIGTSPQVSAPGGQYDPDKLVNIGTNRWYFKPDLGFSKALGPLTLELLPSVTFFTDNNDFFGGNNLAQDPLYAVQGHLIYHFDFGPWVSLNSTYYTGGRTTHCRPGRPAGGRHAGRHAQGRREDVDAERAGSQEEDHVQGLRGRALPGIAVEGRGRDPRVRPGEGHPPPT